MDTTTQEAQVEVTAAPAVVAPTGCILVRQNYSFRRFEDTPANRTKQIPSTADHNITVTVEDEKNDEGKATGKKLFKRETESYDLIVPTPQLLGIPVNLEDAESVKQNRAIQSMITDAISEVARTLVNAGTTVTADNCNWQHAVTAIVTRLDNNIGSGSQYSKEFIDDLCKLFGAFMLAVGKKQEGVTVMTNLIKSRFNPLSCRKYINGLPAVQANLEQWLLEGCDETQQAQYGDAVVYLSECIEKALKPVEVDTGSLF